MPFAKERGRLRPSFINAAANLASIRACSTPGLHAAVRAARARGHKLVAGVDEAGAGALAGPLVCAAVALRGGTADLSLDELGDSKKLSAKKRARLHAQLNADASVVIATAVLSAGEVDRLNILEARRTGLAQAVDALPDAPDFLFVDGIFTLPDAPVPLNQQEAVIQGDASISVVAAASIVAKEVRDTIMAGKLHEKFPQFEFDRHKGYGTARHRALLHEFGPCSEHRFSFRPVREAAAVHCVQVAPSSPLC